VLVDVDRAGNGLLAVEIDKIERYCIPAELIPAGPKSQEFNNPGPA
jgi:hypothetical protein